MRKILTTLVAAVTIGAATLAIVEFGKCLARRRLGLGLGPRRICGRRPHRQRAGSTLLLSVRLLRQLRLRQLRLRQLRLLQLRLRPIPLLRTWLLWLPAGMEWVGVGLCLLLIDP